MFAHIKYGSTARIDFWNKNKGAMRKILEEIQRDVFEGRGEIKEDYKSNGGIGDRFSYPDLWLDLPEDGFDIAICTSAGGGLMVGVHSRSYNGIDSNVPAEFVAQFLKIKLEYAFG